MTDLKLINQDYEEKYGFHDPEQSVFQTPKGITRETVIEISKQKNEPQWMLDLRLKAFDIFMAKQLPAWGGDLSKINFDEIIYYVKPTDKKGRTWEEVPENIKRTFERLGIPEAERKFLSGVGAQYDSEVVYHNIREDLAKKGVIFLDTDSGLKEHEELFKKWFGKVVPAGDNKFAALNSAVWSGGSFIYVPPGIKVDVPLQAYFRINAQNMGQFERTLIIADKGAEVTYIEGCTAPVYATDSLHTAVVELIALEGAKIRYTTLQNWSNNVYNLVTKRAFAYENAVVEWLDMNLGSKLTMKYPSVYLMERNAKADILSIAFAGKGQHQDAGGKVIHLAKDTTSRIVSKSISKDGGRASYRGLLRVAKGAEGVTSTVRCDALMLDSESRSDAYPTMQIDAQRVTISHEATVGKIGDDQLFYLMSKGLTQNEALSMIVLGFIAQFTRELPMEYAVELNRLVQLEIEGH